MHSSLKLLWKGVEDLYVHSALIPLSADSQQLSFSSDGLFGLKNELQTGLAMLNKRNVPGTFPHSKHCVRFFFLSFFFVSLVCLFSWISFVSQMLMSWHNRTQD